MQQLQPRMAKVVTKKHENKRSVTMFDIVVAQITPKQMEDDGRRQSIVWISHLNCLNMFI